MKSNYYVVESASVSISREMSKEKSGIYTQQNVIRQ